MHAYTQKRFQSEDNTISCEIATLFLRTLPAGDAVAGRMESFPDLLIMPCGSKDDPKRTVPAVLGRMPSCAAVGRTASKGLACPDATTALRGPEVEPGLTCPTFII